MTWHWCIVNIPRFPNWLSLPEEPCQARQQGFVWNMTRGLRRRAPSSNRGILRCKGLLDLIYIFPGALLIQVLPLPRNHLLRMRALCRPVIEPGLVEMHRRNTCKPPHGTSRPLFAPVRIWHNRRFVSEERTSGDRRRTTSFWERVAVETIICPSFSLTFCLFTPCPIQFGQERFLKAFFLFLKTLVRHPRSHPWFFSWVFGGIALSKLTLTIFFWR